MFYCKMCSTEVGYDGYTAILFLPLQGMNGTATRRCQVLLDKIKTTDTKNIGKGLFYPQITVKPGYYGEEKPQPSTMLLQGG